MCVCVHSHVYDVHGGRYAHLTACKRLMASVIMHKTGASKVFNPDQDVGSAQPLASYERTLIVSVEMSTRPSCLYRLSLSRFTE